MEELVFEMDVLSDGEWVCPLGCKQVIVWKSRSEYQIIEVLQGFTYLMMVSQGPGSFGNFSFDPDSDKKGFRLTFTVIAN